MTDFVVVMEEDRADQYKMERRAPIFKKLNRILAKNHLKLVRSNPIIDMSNAFLLAAKGPNVYMHGPHMQTILDRLAKSRVVQASFARSTPDDEPFQVNGQLTKRFMQANSDDYIMQSAAKDMSEILAKYGAILVPASGRDFNAAIRVKDQDTYSRHVAECLFHDLNSFAMNGTFSSLHSGPYPDKPIMVM